eukprot:TRINITY_DN9888_c1_g1_i1.p1 TRINITY_DN9888_c1_g1~~TRINITY_DN9888_c1_g1_i1.p1  ORF type:complete len:429 (-),score=45.93 TRINITY_DN9888_c1_g1_i1:407-1522(-)
MASTSQTTTAQEEVFIERDQGAAIAVLNRQKALNALNTFMVEKVAEIYQKWEQDDRVHCVVLKGAGEKAFCSGGDVKSAVLSCRAGKLQEAVDFFYKEYTCDWIVANLSKPHVSLIDGIVMGGGAGISVNGHFTVATERTLFAMPESAIGFFADVGAAHYLNTRMPKPLGMYLALTGARLKGIDVKNAGIATHYVSSENIHQVESVLQDLGKDGCDLSLVDATLKKLETQEKSDPGAGTLSSNLPDIMECFNKDNVQDIFRALQEKQEQSDFCKLTLEALQKLSPLTLKITFSHLYNSRGKSLTEVLNMDYRLAYHICKGPSDFDEGIRAVLIDKDQNPKWRYPTVEQVPDDVVSDFFKPVEGELSLQSKL